MNAILAVTVALMTLWLIDWWFGGRKWTRWRNGLCPRCGYDLRMHNDRCPECGRPVQWLDRDD